MYIQIILDFSIVSHIVLTYPRKSIFGYCSMAYAMVAIGTSASSYRPSRIHHRYLVYTIDISFKAQRYLVFTTIYDGSIQMKTPMICAIGFIIMFTVGGVIDKQCADVGLYRSLHDNLIMVYLFSIIDVAGQPRSQSSQPGTTGSRI